MFQDVSLDQLAVPSTWRRERKVTVHDTQTDTLSFGEGEAQTVVSLFKTTETSEATTQSLEVTPPLEGVGRKGDTWVYAGKTEAPKPAGGDDEIVDESYIDADLLQFLEAVCPPMLAQLEVNIKTSAFAGYSVSWEEQKETVSCLHTLTLDTHLDTQLQALGLAWNCNGSILAVAYGRIDIVGWCSEKGYLCTWNVLRGEVAKPDVMIEVDNYVMCCAFHPEEPTLVAGGTYNGEVIVWDTAKTDDRTVAQTPSTFGVLAHTDPVLQLTWVANRRESKLKFMLMSVSGDGKVLIWTLQNQMQQAVGGYETGKGTATGVTCITVLRTGPSAWGSVDIPTLENTVLIGTEIGGVCRTSIRPVPPDPKKIVLLDHNLVVFRFENHTGPVQQIQASPFHRNMFLTCSSDGTVKVFNSYETSCVFRVVPSSSVDGYLYDASWSPTRPSVFACVAKDGLLHIVDCEESRSKPSVSLQAGTEGKPVLALQFHPTGSLVATGDAKGHVRVWQLSNTLSQPSAKELAAVKGGGQRFV
eukprot:TRINITY_DN1705_c0_g1_i1.p1 TRINITY_DN1705_c0_g1~~TRINITY_DN1705_c0_g1_i1.p1  ORF type:complete len:528 (+),score=92.41 TRINITY_DN1705_c0_g1_i1:65-1648(+)